MGRTALIGGIVGSAVLLMAGPADGDVGVVSVHPTVAGPGQAVTLGVACGGEQCPSELPISLVPLARAPKPFACEGGTAVCSQTAADPPRHRPYVFLGPAQQASPSLAVTSYRLRFRVPRIAPGLYVFVIWRGGAQGVRGTLVVDTSEAGKLLRVRPEQNPVASQGSDTDALWFIGAAAGVIAIAGAAVLLRRRRAQ